MESSIKNKRRIFFSILVLATLAGCELISRLYIWYMDIPEYKLTFNFAESSAYMPHPIRGVLATSGV